MNLCTPEPKGLITPTVTPLSVDCVHVVIKCPYCRQKHYHGSCGGGHYWGHRVAHCDVKFTHINARGYVIGRLPEATNGKQ